MTTTVKPLRIDIPVRLNELRIAFSIADLAFEGDLPEPFECKSNLFELEWPPRSGKYQEFPEVDRACFFSEEIAKRKLKSRQIPFLDRLRVALADRNTDPTRP